MRNTDAFSTICKKAESQLEVVGNHNSSMPKNDPLTCRYQHHGVDYLRLGPLKIEEVNRFPFVVVFHDFLHDGEADGLKAMVGDNLSVSQIAGNDNAKNTDESKRSRLVLKDIVNLRTVSNLFFSKQTWLEDRTYRSYIEADSKAKRLPIFVTSNHKNNLTDSPVNIRLAQKPANELAFKISQRITLATQFTVLSPYASEPYQVIF